MRTGRSGAGLHAVMSLVMVLGIGLCMPSWAFFPTGGFKQFENTPFFMRWGFNDLDVDGDGDVRGPQDGILVTIDVGADGFTAAEANAIRQAFQTWQDVPGSYIAFRFQEIEGPFPVSTDSQVNAVNDPFNSVSLGDIGGLLTVTYSSVVVLDESVITVAATGQQVLVRGPRILESDIVISDAFWRPEEPVDPDPEDPISLIPRAPNTLSGLLPMEVGLFLGIANTPLNNVRDDPADGIFEVEDSVIAMRGADGIVRIVGVTPTMYNPIVLTESPDGGTVDFHQRDLAYDDVAAAMYLYPRVEQVDDLFTIAQEARTTARSGIPSSPIVGGHIIAWVDQDRNPTTNRVPMISTMSGLYNNEVPIGELSGRFQLLGLFKRIVDANGNLFSPDYVLSIEPLPGGLAQAFDSMHTPLAPRPPGAYNSLFPFEVYNEAGNLFNRGNVRFGTPLYYDTVRRQVVSRDSGLTLSQQLRRNAPMFGEESDICFFDIVGDPGGGGGGVQPPVGFAALASIRGFRDNVLLRSRVGTAITDAYYRATPAVASYLLTHENVLRAARSAFAAVLWITMVPSLVWAALALAVGALAGRRFIRRRSALAAATAMVAAMAFLVPATTEAARILATPEQMVQKSQAIIAGEVTAVESYYSTDMLPAEIVTDVSVNVSQSLKGTLNKGSTVTIRMPGGQVGGHVVTSSGHPRLAEGEEVVLLVGQDTNKSIGLTLPYGAFGAFRVIEREDSEAKHLSASSMAGYNDIQRIASAVNEAAMKRGVYKSAAETESDGFTLDAFAAFVDEVEAGR